MTDKARLVLLPEGWVAVPKEATMKMLREMTCQWDSIGHRNAGTNYAAMLAAAPSLPEPDTASEIDRLNAERHDLALLVARLIRRMRAARAGEGMSAGDDALGQQAIDYLRRKGLVIPLREDPLQALADQAQELGLYK